MEKEKHSICLDCLYSGQPYGYFPIICCKGDIKEMYYEKRKCNKFKRATDYVEESTMIENKPQVAWQVIKGGKQL